MASVIVNGSDGSTTPLPPVDIQEMEAAEALASARNAHNNNNTARDPTHIQFKIIIVGATGVGKTKLLDRFRGRPFTDSGMATIGVEFCPKYFRILSPALGTPVIACAQLWDTAGQERYSSMTPLYYRGAVGVMVVFSLTDSDSFKEAERYFAEAQMHSGAGNQLICVLAGNKVDLCDKQRQVSTSQWQAWAAERNVIGFETSAKTDVDVRTAFAEIIRLSVLRLLSRRLLVGISTAAGAAMVGGNGPTLPPSSRVIADDDPLVRNATYKPGVVSLFDDRARDSPTSRSGRGARGRGGAPAATDQCAC